MSPTASSIVNSLSPTEERQYKAGDLGHKKDEARDGLMEEDQRNTSNGEECGETPGDQELGELVSRELSRLLSSILSASFCIVR
jgi:hypothetical protein